MNLITSSAKSHNQRPRQGFTSDEAGRRNRGGVPIGLVVLASLTAGLVSALILAAAPFIPATQNGMTAAALLGFALGWALLAVLSARYTDQPQRWAAGPALFLGSAAAILLVAPYRLVDEALAWVWPAAAIVLVVWTFAQAKGHLRSRSRWLLINPVLAVLALAALGAGYETAREALDSHAYAMPGQLIDVGGHQLHLSCTGTGAPTVVLEPGAGEMSSHMGWIAPAVAADTRVCVYDRAGRGWSEPAQVPQDAAQIATDLHTLLHRAAVPGPYVLAGHSFGGLYVRTFAARYPDEVSGLVLVDSTAPAAHATATGNPEPPAELRRVSAVVSAMARLGLGRLAAQFSYETLPPQARDEARASMATADQWDSTVDEFLEATASTRQAATLVDFADKPLVVLTAGRGSSPAWFADQDQMAALSTNSSHRIIADATHSSLVEHEHDASAVTEAIHDVIASTRAGTPLDSP